MILFLNLTIPEICSKIGLVMLSRVFEQRKVKATSGSFTSYVPLETPSGPQWTESELETELLRQIAFAPGVYDIITQPIINYVLDGKPRRYTPDIVVQLRSSGDQFETRFIIEVKRNAELAKPSRNRDIRFAVGQAAAEAIGGHFRVMTESEIRTPYLENTKRLSRHAGSFNFDDTILTPRNALQAILPASVRDAVSRLRELGYAEPDARHIIEQYIAHRLVFVDLMKPLTDDSVLRDSPFGDGTEPREDGIIQLLFKAKSR